SLQRVDFLVHGAGVTDDAACPVEHAFALRGEALKTGAALHEQHAEGILELLDAGRQRRLAHAASLGGMTEMPLAGERDDEFKFIDHAVGPEGKGWPSSSQEAAVNARARVGATPANMTDQRRPMRGSLMRVAAGMGHGHALRGPAHREAS